MNREEILKLDQLHESFGDDPETFIAVLEMFMVEVPQDYDNLKKHVAQHDYHASGLLAHKVKSSYRMLGMEQETLLLQEIENRAKNNDEVDKIPVLFDQFEKDYPAGLKQVMRTIKDLQDRVNPQ